MRPNWNWLERLVFSVSCVLVLGVLGYVAMDAWTMGNAPPDLIVTLGKPARGSGGWRVPVTVENQGDAAAEQVRVGVVFRQEGQVLEQAEFFIAYVPRRSRREGWVTFRREPPVGALEAWPLGYAEP